MKKSIVLIIALFSFAACDLNKLEPAQTKSFMKYFGDVGKTYGEDILKLDDGYLLLGNNYSNEDRQGFEFSALIKTDLNGNTIWVQTHADIEGRSLAKTNDGYFIVGDGINGTNSTMMLIKTNLEGSQIAAVTPLASPTASYHGTAITISSANEVVVSGYIDQDTGSDEFFVYGYPTDLSDSNWDDIFTSPRENVTTARNLQEIESTGPGTPFFVSTCLYNAGAGNELENFAIRKNEETPGPSPPLLEEFTLTDEIGALAITTPNDRPVVQTVIIDGNSAILFAQTRQQTGDQSPVIISPANEPGDNYNYTVSSILKASDGNYVVLGSTDNTPDRDTDYFVKKVAFDGSDITDGFTLSFGGTAEEYGARIIEADDGGYVFIGTHENPNEVDFMVLVKITKDGKLIN